MAEPLCVCLNYTVANIYAHLIFLLSGKGSSKHLKHHLTTKSPDVAQPVMEAEFLPCQDAPSPTNKPLNGSFDDLDIPYIDEEEDEDSITAWWHIHFSLNNRIVLWWCFMNISIFFFILEKRLWGIYIYLTGSHVDRPFTSVHCIFNIFQSVQCMLYSLVLRLKFLREKAGEKHLLAATEWENFNVNFFVCFIFCKTEKTVKNAALPIQLTLLHSIICAARSSPVGSEVI